MIEQPKTRGGKRPGAGRPFTTDEKIVNLSATIFAKDLALLREIAPTIREAIRKLLDRKIGY